MLWGWLIVIETYIPRAMEMRGFADLGSYIPKRFTEDVAGEERRRDDQLPR